MNLKQALEYIRNLPFNKKNHDSWTELWKKDRDFRFAVCVILGAVEEGLLEEKDKKMKAYQYENRITGKQITLSETQIKDINFDFGMWAYENDYELVKTIELGEDSEEKETQRPYKEYQDLRTGELVREYKENENDKPRKV